MNLSDVFAAVAYKRLAMVDLPNLGSNQHELSGVSALRSFFHGEVRDSGMVEWHYFADDQEPHSELGSFTFYDSRKKSAARTGRTEWRFYYKGDFLACASVGDLLVMTQTLDGQYHGLIFEAESSWIRAAAALWGINGAGPSFDFVSEDQLEVMSVEFQREQILAALNITVDRPISSQDEDIVTNNFGKKFPSTEQMSAFARKQIDVDRKASDQTLLLWLEREEQLFRALEKVVVSEKIARGFATVEEFIAYSLSVHNRRKARMGYALQNHLAELFKRHKLKFKAQACTESTNKPDFLFPGEREYHDEAFDAELLVVLGAKSTVKERWRQVLTEADRVPRKHLCTLEAGISEKQTSEMSRQSLTLVIPAGLHSTYTGAQRKQILSIAEFIELVAQKQIRR
jgi:hypothetical protein